MESGLGALARPYSPGTGGRMCLIAVPDGPLVGGPRDAAGHRRGIGSRVLTSTVTDSATPER